MTFVNVNNDGQPMINNKDIIKWYLSSMEAQSINQQSEPVQDPNSPALNEINRVDRADQDLESHEQANITGEDVNICIEMEEALRDGATTSWDKLCIYRVPPYLRENDKKSYIPQTVSLGPYHHGNEHLLPMEHHKWRAVNRIMERTGHNIQIYFNAMKKLEEKARACYQGPIASTIDDFTKMLLLDGCFVLELFRGTVEGFQNIGYADNDPVFATRGLMHSIQRDMVMLENQLPLFVLNQLLKLQLGSQYQDGLVTLVAVKFFDPLLPMGESVTKRNETNIKPWLVKSLGLLGDNGELHCLDVFHRRLRQYSRKPNPGSQKTPPVAIVENKQQQQQQQLVHCVTELREAGVKFKRKKDGQFWDIRFKNGCLEIPKLLIHDGTKPLFSNLIAFELCHINSSKVITSYAVFMDNLINSPEDVSYLHYCGIIEHWLGSDFEVADLFNQLCREVFFDPKQSHLSQLSNEVNHYYNRKWNFLKATLRHKYFNNPWAYFSFSAAVILLILTLSQTYFAAYSYFMPPS